MLGFILHPNLPAQFIGGVLQHRVRFPQHKAIVIERRYRCIRVDGEVFRRLLSGGKVVDFHRVIFHAEQIESGDNLAADHGAGVAI